MEQDVCYIARKGFLVRHIAGESMLIPVDTGEIIVPEYNLKIPEFNGMIQLDEVGEFLWEQLTEAKTLEELVTAVKNNFDIGDEDISQDIMDFVMTGMKSHIIFMRLQKDA